MTRAPVITCLLLLLLAACQQDRTPDTSNSPSAEGAKPAAADTAPPTTAKSVMDYACEGGHHVAIVDGGNVARISFSDGRVIDLPRSPDRAPPLYAGEALEFAVTSNGGMLGQDELGGIPCEVTV